MKKLDGKWIDELDHFVALVESIERSTGKITRMDVDLILQELRNLYMLTLEMDPCKYEIVEKKTEVANDAVSETKPEAKTENVEDRAVQQRIEAEEIPAAKQEMIDEEMEEVLPEEEIMKVVKKEAPIAPQHFPIPEMGAEPIEGQPKFAEEESVEEVDPTPQVEIGDGTHYHDLFDTLPETESISEPIAKTEPVVEPAPMPKEEPVVAPEPILIHKADPVAEPVVKAEPVAEPAPTPKAEPVIAPEPILIHKTEPVVEPAPMPKEEPVVAPEPVAPKPKQATSLIDFLHTPSSRQQPTTRTLADTLGKNPAGNAYSNQISQQKVSDLRNVININDKFSFMTELFHSNMKAYSDFILVLNGMSEREEALEYVAQVAEQYNWDNESLTVKNFYAIFDRKF